LQTVYRKYDCDHAIVTIPLGVLKNSPQLFTPPLDAAKVKYAQEQPAAVQTRF